MSTSPKPIESKLSTLLILPDQMEDYHKIKKTGGFRELVLPGNDFKTCSTVNFPKKHPNFGGVETNHEIQT